MSDEQSGRDRRTVSTDALETLGTFIDETQKRDAIHLAVEPVIAGERLPPGAHITVKNGRATRADAGQGLGIVDPFLPIPVKPGERFWFVMYPRQVRSLRHVWTHPAFPDEMATAADTESRSEGQRYIDGYAQRLGLSTRALIEAANDYLDNGEYLIQGSRFEGEYIPGEFWPHFSAYTGRKLKDGEGGNFLSCSC